MEDETPRFRKVEAKSKKKNHGGLDDWFHHEKWVDVSRPKKDGGYEACGRGDTSKGKKPVCTPANKAKNLTHKERKNRIRQKRHKEKESNPDKKPNVTKYTEQAGGKSNVSNNHNIRFIGSMIPLSELRPVQPRFVKISAIEDEDLEKAPFEIPTSPIEDERENFHDEINNISGNHPALNYIIALYKMIEDNLYEMGDKKTIDALKSLDINVGNERFDQYYHNLIEVLVNSLNQHIDEFGTVVMGVPEDNPRAKKFAYELQKAMLGFMLNIAHKVNIFNDKRYEYFILSMLKQTMDVEWNLNDSI
jgi:hypothetical protein